METSFLEKKGQVLHKTRYFGEEKGENYNEKLYWYRLRLRLKASTGALIKQGKTSKTTQESEFYKMGKTYKIIIWIKKWVELITV